jgi:WD40 repeat protein
MLARSPLLRVLLLVSIFTLFLISIGFVQQYTVAAQAATRTPRPTRTPTGTPTTAPTLVAVNDLEPITADNASKLVELTAIRQTVAGTSNREMAFSPASGLIAVGDNKGTITLWNFDGLTKGQTLTTNGELQALAFNADGTVLASASWSTQATNATNKNKTITLWDTKTGEKLIEPKYTRRVQSLRFSPDGKLLASGSGESGTGAVHDIYIWDTEDGSQVTVLKGHKGIVNNLRFTDDGAQLASASADGTLRLWDANGKSAHTVFQHTFALPDDPAQPMYGTWSGTGTVTGRTGNFLVGFTVSEDGTKVLTSYLFEGRTIHLSGGATIKDDQFAWRITSGTTSIQLNGTFSSQTQLDGTLKSGALQGKWTAKPSTPTVRDVVFSADGSLMISPNGNSRLLFWDVAAKSVATLVKGGEVNEDMASIALTSDGKSVITVGSKLRLWNIADGAAAFESDKLKSNGSHLSITPDGKMIVWMDTSGFVRVWGIPAN